MFFRHLSRNTVLVLWLHPHVSPADVESCVNKGFSLPIPARGEKEREYALGYPNAKIHLFLTVLETLLLSTPVGFSRTKIILSFPNIGKALSKIGLDKEASRHYTFSQALNLNV
jgi:hypothetical protein